MPACLAVYVFAQQRGLISRILQLSPLVMLGEMSYSIYLFHDPLKHYYVVNKAPETPNLEALIVCLSVIMGLAYLTWICLETPARKAIYRRFAKADSPDQPSVPRRGDPIGSAG